MGIKLLVIIIAIPLFLFSTAGYIYSKLRLKPKDDSELDDYYWEFEDQDPGYAKYIKYSQMTLMGVVVSMLLLFLALVF